MESVELRGYRDSIREAVVFTGYRDGFKEAQNSGATETRVKESAEFRGYSDSAKECNLKTFYTLISISHTVIYDPSQVKLVLQMKRHIIYV